MIGIPGKTVTRIKNRSRARRLRVLTGADMDNPVGPILRMSDEVENVVDAIRDDNPDREIEVIGRGAFVRVQADDYLLVTEESLQRHLGTDFRIRSLEAMLTAFAGRIETRSDRIEWHLSAKPHVPVS